MSLSLVQQCLQDVSDWMIASKLKINPDKTEFIVIGAKSQRDKFKKYFPTKLLDQDVTCNTNWFGTKSRGKIWQGFQF